MIASADYSCYERFLNRLSDLRGPDGRGMLTAKCPLNNHRSARLRIWLGEENKLLFGCWAGCEKRQILLALGLNWRDCFPPQEPREKRSRRPVAWYPYYDEAGHFLYEQVRFEPGKNGTAKDFQYRRRGGNGEPIWGLGDCRRVLYRLPELLANTSAPLIVVEGEKKVERLERLGLLATTAPGGARSWREDYGKWLSGRAVAILPDNNAAGMTYAHLVAASALMSGCERLRVVLLPGLETDEDVVDWLRREGAGMTDAEQRELLLREIKDSVEYRRQK